MVRRALLVAAAAALLAAPGSAVLVLNPPSGGALVVQGERGASKCGDSTPTFSAAFDLMAWAKAVRFGPIPDGVMAGECISIVSDPNFPDTEESIIIQCGPPAPTPLPQFLFFYGDKDCDYLDVPEDMVQSCRVGEELDGEAVAQTFTCLSEGNGDLGLFDEMPNGIDFTRMTAEEVAAYIEVAGPTEATQEVWSCYHCDGLPDTPEGFYSGVLDCAGVCFEQALAGDVHSQMIILYAALVSGAVDTHAAGADMTHPGVWPALIVPNLVTCEDDDSCPEGSDCTAASTWGDSAAPYARKLLMGGIPCPPGGVCIPAHCAVPKSDEKFPPPRAV